MTDATKRSRDVRDQALADADHSSLELCRPLRSAIGVIGEQIRGQAGSDHAFARSVFLSGVHQAGLQITDDRAEQARREQPRSEGAGGVLTHGRQFPQGGSDRGRHMAKLPADLVADSLRPVRGGQSCRLSGIRGRTQGVRAHMRNGCGLSRRSRSGHRCGTTHLTSRATTDETATNFPRDVKFTTGKRPCPGDGITGTAIPRSFGVEESQHALRTVSSPHRNDPPVSLTQRLRRTHPRSLPRRARTLGSEPADARMKLGRDGELTCALDGLYRVVRPGTTIERRCVVLRGLGRWLGRFAAAAAAVMGCVPAAVADAPENSAVLGTQTSFGHFAVDNAHGHVFVILHALAAVFWALTDVCGVLLETKGVTKRLIGRPKRELIPWDLGLSE
jgi:hypothetical protein